MLTTIRERAQGWIAWVIVILITIPFALWGIGEYFSAQETVVVAEVNGDELLAQDYQETLTRRRASLRQQFGRNIDASVLESDVFKRRILDEMIAQRLVVDDLRAQRYRIGDEQLADYIRNNEAFQENGQFSADLYSLALRRNRLSPIEFENRLRTSNMISQVSQGFDRSVIVVDAELDDLIRLEQERRDVAWIEIDSEAHVADVVVSDADVQARYEQNRQAYMTDEQLRIEYIELSLDEIAAQITPDEASLQAEYAERKTNYTRAEQRGAQHILLAVAADADEASEAGVRQQAEELVQQLRDGADFAELARAHSTDSLSAEKGGDLGLFERGVMVGAFEDAVFAMEVGQVSDPVRSQYGYHVIKLNEIKAQEIKPYAEVREQIAEEYARREATSRFGQMAEEMQNLVYEQPNTLQAAADALGLKVQQSEWFSRSGGDGIAAESPVVASAFSEDVLQEGLNSEVMEVGEDRLVALRRLEHRPSELRPLADVTDEIRDQLRQQARGEQLTSLAREYVVKLRRGEATLASIAADLGVGLNERDGVGRAGSEGLSEGFIDALFRTPIDAEGGDRSAGTLPLDEGKVAIYSVRQVTPGDPAAAPAGLREQLRQILVQRKGVGLVGSYEAGLRRQAEITVYEDRL